MPALLLFVVTACVGLAVLSAVCNLGVFVLSRRAKLNPSYVPEIRAVLLLATLFVLPRILPYPALLTGVLVGLIGWEFAARIRWATRRTVRPKPVRLGARPQPTTNGLS